MSLMENEDPSLSGTVLTYDPNFLRPVAVFPVLQLLTYDDQALNAILCDSETCLAA